MKKRRKGDDDSCLITFGGQKDSFYNAKGLHLHSKRTPFTMQKDYIRWAKGLHLKRRKILLPREETIATSRESKKKAQNQTVSGANYIVCISRAERACCQNRARQ